MNQHNHHQHNRPQHDSPQHDWPHHDWPHHNCIVITPGEPGGINGEIIVKAAHHFASQKQESQKKESQIRLATIDDPARLNNIAETLKLPLKIEAVDTISDANSLKAECLAVLPIAWAETPKPGYAAPANAPQVIDAIKTAAEYARQGRIKAMVTAPIQKASLYQTGFAFPGHTEYLAALDGGSHPVMMLACKGLKTVPATLHIPLAQVPQALSRQGLVKMTRIVDQALRCDFGIKEPRIVMAGLNPHAGENATIGLEERDIITPALQDLRKHGVTVCGPLSADTLFYEEHRKTFDAVIAMYHDQALIPVKTIDFHGGVNITLGLSFVRTSPDHGTALDKAKAGDLTANPRSLITAITMADEMATRRANRRYDHGHGR